MEKKIISELKKVVTPNIKFGIEDLRKKLSTNPNGKKWKLRNVQELKGMVWHQELGWGTVENVAKYHTGRDSHLTKGGVESIAYSFAIRKSGEIVLCNDLNKATWSQGYKGRKGDENKEFLAVMFEGLFRADTNNDNNSGEPTLEQIHSAFHLWSICKKLWNWNNGALYGHYHFGKPACPGDTLKKTIEAIRFNNKSDETNIDLSNVKGRQEALKKLGFYKQNIDGIWGPYSKSCLIKFQAKHSLVPDGIWGPNTEKKIKETLKK